jgi:F0F1-type ATP synthase membrane subunit c/vacuolar-type H+-ATPase subunit K
MRVRLQKKGSLAALLLTALFNTIIAVFLTLLEYGRSLETNWVVSQSIGLCICAFILAGYHLLNTGSRLRQVLMVICCILAGAGPGAAIGAWMTGGSAADIFSNEPSLFFQMLMIALVFGLPITYFFIRRANACWETLPDICAHRFPQCAGRRLLWVRRSIWSGLIWTFTRSGWGTDCAGE